MLLSEAELFQQEILSMTVSPCLSVGAPQVLLFDRLQPNLIDGYLVQRSEIPIAFQRMAYHWNALEYGFSMTYFWVYAVNLEGAL